MENKCTNCAFSYTERKGREVRYMCGGGGKNRLREYKVESCQMRKVK